jgi:hypothetical protein
MDLMEMMGRKIIARNDEVGLRVMNSSSKRLHRSQSSISMRPRHGSDSTERMACRTYSFDNTPGFGERHGQPRRREPV